MATIKKDFGISLYTKSSTSENEKGEALLEGFSQSNTSKLQLIYPKLSTRDKYIDSNYILFSFSLSREWVELGYFLTPRFTLIIEGRNLDEQRNFQQKNNKNYSHIKILRRKLSTGTNIVCEWNKYFGIARLSVETALLCEFNEILAVGIVMTTDNDSKPTGRIFRFDDISGQKIKEEITRIYGNNSIENINSYIKADSLCRLKGAEENPVFDSIDITGRRIMIAPLEAEKSYYSLYGIYMDENGNYNSYENPIYYYNAACISFRPILKFNSYIRPKILKIDNEQEFGQQVSCYIRINPNDEGIYEKYKPENIEVMYGGYQYKGVIDENQSIVHYSNFGFFKNIQGNFDGNLFYQQFNFSSEEQYRTSFKDYIFGTTESPTDIPTDVNLLCSKISGKLSINNKNNPFNINANISTDGYEYLLVDNQTTIENLPDYIEVSAKDLGMINRFTGKVETDEKIKIRFPVYDEYDFYFLGDSLTFKKEGKIVKKYSNTQAVVKYADMEYNDDLVPTKLHPVSNIDTNNITNNIRINWEIKRTKIPQNSYPNSDESLSIKDNESYFEYRKPYAYLAEKVITDKIKFYWDFDYYEILCSRAFPSSNILDKDKGTFRIHSLKIQDNKLYYEISAGAIGDCNDDFSVNQFINYGINEKRPIGLSSFDGNKKLMITPMIGTEEVGDPLLVETGNGDSASTLKKFYTNMLHTIDMEADKVAALSAALSTSGGTLSLKLTYYDDNGTIDTISKDDDYLIFEFIVNDISIISGSRPLGLRRNGIIINPITPNEELDNSAERINFKTSLDGQNKLFGSAIQLIAYDANGSKLKDSEGNYITCEIEYKGTKAQNWSEADPRYDGSFYFDGISLQELSGKVEKIIKALSDSSII